jgi:hypothetical protein
MSIVYNSFVTAILQKEVAIDRRLGGIIHHLQADGYKTKMWEFVNSVLITFHGCFTRKATFQYFVIIVLGFMLRCEHAGISSIIRTLALQPVKYESLVHFFVLAHGASWLSKNNGYTLSELPVFCSQRMECLFSSGTG